MTGQELRSLEEIKQNTSGTFTSDLPGSSQRAVVIPESRATPRRSPATTDQCLPMMHHSMAAQAPHPRPAHLLGSNRAEDSGFHAHLQHCCLLFIQGRYICRGIFCRRGRLPAMTLPVSIFSWEEGQHSLPHAAPLKTFHHTKKNM